MSVKGSVLRKIRLFCCLLTTTVGLPSMNAVNFMNIPKTTRVSSAYKINVRTSGLHAKYNSASLSADLYDKTRDLLYLLISHPL